MNFNNQQIEKIINDMFPGMTFYYRDADLPKEIIEKYKHRQIIRNGIFLDVSSLGGKLIKNTRFLIASNKAAPLFQLNPDVAKWRLHTITLNTYFQVIDIIKENGKNQILLVQIPKEGVPLFQSAWINLLDDIVKKGKESFEQKKSLEPIPALQEEEWIKRTEFPIGIDGKNEFFELFPGQANPPQREKIASNIKEEPKNPQPNEQPQQKKSSFWNRLFGK